MLTEHFPSVSVEEVEADIPSGSAIGIDVKGVLLEPWCIHELQWVVDERNTPPVWAQVVRHLRGYLGSLWGPPGRQRLGGLFRDL